MLVVVVLVVEMLVVVVCSSCSGSRSSSRSNAYGGVVSVSGCCGICSTNAGGGYMWY